MGARRFNLRLVGLHRQEACATPEKGFPIALLAGLRQTVQLDTVELGTTTLVQVGASPGETWFKFPKISSDHAVCIFVGETAVQIDCGLEGNVYSQPAACWFAFGCPDLRVAWAADGHITLVSFPRQVLEDFGIDAASALWALSTHSSLLSPVAQFLQAVCLEAGPTSTVAAYFLEKLVHEMLGGLALDSLGAFPGHQRLSLYSKAMAYVAASAGDVGLTPSLLAEKFNVSLRHLQREFSKKGQTIADTIRQARIDLALRLLTDDSYMMLDLDQVSTHAGFASLGHLRRTLRKAGFGSPRDIRRLGIPSVDDDDGARR